MEELSLRAGAHHVVRAVRGLDQRILDHLCTDVVSIGPYVLSGGEIPALALVDAVARRLPGALTGRLGRGESFSAALDGGLEYPHYTRPAEFRGWTVPEILLSGRPRANRRMAPRPRQGHPVSDTEERGDPARDAR